MKDSNNPQDSSANQAEAGFSPWQRLKTKRISYLTLPLLVMATITEFVILATGFKYQQVVCIPQGMGVTFFGIGPIGCTILAVELLKLPLAIWTASRIGWQKGVMLFIGLPLICLLTFQLVKDMAVYEMGVAMTPASQFLEKGAVEDTKIAQLNADLAAIEGKKTDRQRKLAELAAKDAKAKADLEELLKHNNDVRTDAITLTEYQKKELAEVGTRQAAITQQFNADTDQLNKAIAELRTRRETEVSRGSRWNAEEARIENEFKTKMAAYTNRKTAYEKDKAEYESANFLKRQLMREPVDPGVPPQRESNTVLKPTTVAEIDAQLAAKESELLAVNNRRRQSLAQVDADARRIREDFDRRSTTKREEADKKREELTAAQALVAAELKAERKQIDDEVGTAVQSVAGIKEQLDAAQKRAEGFYEAREASIRNTQVHRIATTVEIVRGLLMGERPMSIKATAKERGDILTDQISMVRIWVYPVFAFIVAFLPTLLVEIGFSTVFHPEKERPPYRLGFLGRRLHWLYTRAGRQKILRAERQAREASAEIVARDEALAAANAATATHAEHQRQKEEEWNGRFAAMTDSLNQALADKDAMHDFQQLEIERQVQLRANTWSDRLNQLRQEMDTQLAAHEAERTTTAQENTRKLMEVSEDCKAQVNQARRQMADAALASEETIARLTYELKDAVSAKEGVSAQLQQQSEAAALKLKQAREEFARDIERGGRQETQRAERMQAELAKSLQQHKEEFEHQLKRREQELSLQFDTRLAQEQAKLEQEAHHRVEEFDRQLDARVREVDARWNQELLLREEAAQIRLKQREQQLHAAAELRLAEAQKQAAQDLRRRESELERQIDAQSRGVDSRLKQELQQRELDLQAKLKQREQDLAAKVTARETELQNQWAADLRAREEDWERKTEARVRAVEARVESEKQHQEELFQSKLRQRDQQWQIKLDAAKTESQAQIEEAIRRRGAEADAGLRELEGQLRNEMQQRDEAAKTKAKKREQELTAQLSAQFEAHKMSAHAQWQMESEVKLRAAVDPVKALLIRAERERDEAKQSSSETTRHVQDLEKKLTEASLFLNAWRNGKDLAGRLDEKV